MCSMKARDTIAGKMYTVTSPNGCAVTDENGTPLGSVESGEQKLFVATGSKLLADDDSAVITATFNRAARALRMLAGGVKSDLPEGYLRAEFLESTTGFGNMNQKIKLPAIFDLSADSITIETMHSNGFYNGALSVEGSNTLGYGLNYNGNPVFLVNGANVSNKTLDRVTANLEFVWRVESTPSKQKMLMNGETVAEAATAFTAGEVDFGLFGTNTGERTFRGRKKYWTLDVNGERVMNLTPAINATGRPCMFDKVSKIAHLPATAVNFTAGFTLAQARKLGAHLPAGGGTLTISLPTGYEQDAAVTESLEAARAKGWTLTIQTYTPEAEAAATTFGMRRVWVRRTQDEQGAYVDADGVRWAVEWCVDMLTPDGSTPDQHGYELYRSTEAAVAYWELQAWVDPEAEELLTTESL